MFYQFALPKKPIYLKNKDLSAKNITPQESLRGLKKSSFFVLNY